jgi:hypothetical protein
MKLKAPKLTDEERATILGNLLHDLAALDPTTEEEAPAISERLVAEGRIDPAKTAEAHRRLLVRLGVKSELESPQALATGSCCTPRACGNQARSVRHAER